MDRKYLIAALLYAVTGMCYGIYMAASKDHSFHPAHAHILLVGFVTSFIYAVIHKLWISAANAKLVMTQFGLHHIGTVLMGTGLTLLFAGTYPEASLGPLLGISSIVVLVAMVLMLVMCLQSSKSTS